MLQLHTTTLNTDSVTPEPINLKPNKQVVPYANPNYDSQRAFSSSPAYQALYARRDQEIAERRAFADKVRPTVHQTHTVRGKALSVDGVEVAKRMADHGTQVVKPTPASLVGVQAAVKMGAAQAPDTSRYKDCKQAIVARQQLSGEIMLALQEEMGREPQEHDPLQRVSDQIAGCCHMPKWAVCGCGTYHWISALRCNSRWCPTCAAIRSKQLSAAIWSALNTEYDESGYTLANDPEIKLLHCVFTVKNGWDLAERLQHLNKSMERLRRKHKVYRDAVLGAAVNREYTFDPESGWHVHAHCILVATKYLPNRQQDLPDQNKAPGLDNLTPLAAAWYKASGDSYIVHVSKVDGQDAVKEVAKYVTKLDEIKLICETPGMLRQLITVTKGRRLFSTWGILYNRVKVDEAEVPTEDWVDPETGEVYAAPEGTGEPFVCACCGSTDAPRIVWRPLALVLQEQPHVWFLRRPERADVHEVQGSSHLRV